MRNGPAAKILHRILLAAFPIPLLFCIPAFAQNRGAIHGMVVDDSTSLPLTGATISLSNSRRGTTTNHAGQFLLNDVSAGKHDLRISYVGYQEFKKSVAVRAGDSLAVTARLRPVILQMPEVKITAVRDTYREKSLQTQPSVIKVSAGEIRRISTFGEPDLFRALQALPGITSTNQASNQLYVRGGSPDQNLVRIDGATIYNPFHLFGLAANFNPDLIGNVTVSTGGFPARYGDRLSSVIDVETRRVNESLVAVGNLSLLSSKLLLAGAVPLPSFQKETARERLKPRAEWMLSARRSYHDWAAKLFSYDLPYHFYDLFGKISLTPNHRHTLSVSAFYSADVLAYRDNDSWPLYAVDDYRRIIEPQQIIGWVEHREDYAFPWNNLASNLRWEFSPSLRWSSTLEVSLSRTSNTGLQANEYTLTPGLPQYYVDLYEDHREGVDWSVNNGLLEVSVSASQHWQPTAAWQFLGGVELSRVKFDYDWKRIDSEDTDIVLFLDRAPYIYHFHSIYRRSSAFVEALWQVTPAFSLQPSLRTDWRSSTKSATLDPRLSATLELNPALRLQGALGRYNQGLTFLREEGIFAVNELFFPMPFTSAATHAIIGAEYAPSPSTMLKLEAYYKKLERQAISLYGATVLGKAPGWAYGVEATLRSGDLQAFYVFSRVQRRFDGVTYHTPWDVRHRFQTSGQIDLGKNWDFSFQWELRTGQPYSPRDIEITVPTAHYDPRTGQTYYHYEQRTIDYPKGAIRYPLYHRLDVTFAKRLSAGGFSVAPYVQILNVYNHKNPLWFEEDYSYFVDMTGYHFESIFKPVTVPVLPSIGMRFAF